MNRSSFELSFADFQAQAEKQGESFWHGVLLGFFSAYVVFGTALGQGVFGLI